MTWRRSVEAELKTHGYDLGQGRKSKIEVEKWLYIVQQERSG